MVEHLPSMWKPWVQSQCISEVAVCTCDPSMRQEGQFMIIPEKEELEATLRYPRLWSQRLKHWGLQNSNIASFDSSHYGLRTQTLV